MRALAVVLGLLLLPAAPARADAPPEVTGDWQCGEARVILTRLGSIEVVSPRGYRAGLFRARGGVLEVTWDGGGEERLAVRRENGALRIEGLASRPVSCTSRN